MYIYTTFYLTIKGNFITKLLHIRLQNYYTTDIIIMMLMEAGSKSKAYCLPGYIVHLFVLYVIRLVLVVLLIWLKVLEMISQRDGFGWGDRITQSKPPTGSPANRCHRERSEARFEPRPVTAVVIKGLILVVGRRGGAHGALRPVLSNGELVMYQAARDDYYGIQDVQLPSCYHGRVY